MYFGARLCSTLFLLLCLTVTSTGLNRAGATRRSGHDREFVLRHIVHHGATQYPHLHRRLDVKPSSINILSTEPSIRLNSRNQLIQRPTGTERSVGRHLRHPHTVKIGRNQQSIFTHWSSHNIDAPNVTDKETVLGLAKIAANAYIQVPETEDWQDLSSVPFNSTGDFGWEDDGLRGHVFADDTNSTVIIALKGTSVWLFERSGTSNNDKVNDNLLFSCCCARVSYMWATVCDCYHSTYSCDQTCLESSVVSEDRYYRAALDLYTNVTELYPKAETWMVGHSMGGSMASLLGLTFGLPTVAFEAPGEKLAAQRLHLPLPPGIAANESGVWHFGHTADPIYMGVCNGPSSSCWLGGYAMETTCKAGLECTYDTVTDKGWRVNFLTHQIKKVIKDVISVYEDVPECIAQPECVDCFNWDFGDHPESTSTSAAPPTATQILTSTSTSKSPSTTHLSTRTAVTPSATGTPPSTDCGVLYRLIGWCKR